MSHLDFKEPNNGFKSKMKFLDSKKSKGLNLMITMQKFTYFKVYIK